MKCPECGSTQVEVPTVDIGVGEQQCAPASCLDCGWVEKYPELLPVEGEFDDLY